MPRSRASRSACPRAYAWASMQLPGEAPLPMRRLHCPIGLQLQMATSKIKLLGILRYGQQSIKSERGEEDIWEQVTKPLTVQATCSGSQPRRREAEREECMTIYSRNCILSKHLNWCFYAN